MIIYLFNSYLNNNLGFANRCKRMLEAYSGIDTVHVLCRSQSKKQESTYKNIPVTEYENSDALVNNSNYSSGALSEIFRNIRLMTIIGKELLSIKKKYPDQQLSIIAVSSPLTVPLAAAVIGKLFRIRLRVLEFHDLEPELAGHIKKLPESHWFIKIEKYLERLVCRVYEKTTVTTQAQKDILVQRTGISQSRVYAYPNLVDLPDTTAYPVKSIRTNLGIPEKALVLIYCSALTLDYSVSELPLLFKILEKLPDIYLLIVGDGEKRDALKKQVHPSVKNRIIFTGKVEHPRDYIAASDIGLVLWAKNAMTETMLPTKLFDYIALKKPVIAPDFGEFIAVISDINNGLLYKNTSDLDGKIQFLYNTRPKAEQLGKNAFKFYTEYAKKYDTKSMVSFLTYEK